MKLTDYLTIEDILPHLASTNKEEVLVELTSALVARHPEFVHDEVLQVLTERERLGSTGIGDGIAIPHGKLRKSEKITLLFARSSQGVAYGALDGRPVQLFFVLLAPQSAAGMHLKMLARISRILKDQKVRHALVAAADVAALYTLISDQDNQF
jgi:PTS system nitrogen regulatory IIA component